MIKLADTLAPMADFPAVEAKDVALKKADGIEKSIQNMYDDNEFGGDSSVELTQAEYDELERKGEVKEDVTYYIKDGNVSSKDDDQFISTKHRLIKDYYFQDKSLQFFGDSIADGVGVEDDAPFCVNKRWTTKFTELMHATEINNAVSGSLYTRGKNESMSITDKVKSTSLTGDCIFLCGGINDWQLGISIKEFTESVTECFNYIKENYSGDVVVVAPFNAIKNLVGTPITTIESYREVLAKLAYKFGFSYINGGLFSLAKTRNAGNRIQYQYYDGLHPSGYGHYLMACEMFMLLSGISSWKELPSVLEDHNFSGEYLPSLDMPIFKVTYGVSFPSEELNNHVIDSRITKNNAVIQSMKGCVVYGSNYNAALPYFTQDQNFIKTFVCYCDDNGFTIQHAGTLEITNGNIFIEYIFINLPKHTY